MVSIIEVVNSVRVIVSLLFWWFSRLFSMLLKLSISNDIRMIVMILIFEIGLFDELIRLVMQLQVVVIRKLKKKVNIMYIVIRFQNCGLVMFGVVVLRKWLKIMNSEISSILVISRIYLVGMFSLVCRLFVWLLLCIVLREIQMFCIIGLNRVVRVYSVVMLMVLVLRKCICEFYSWVVRFDRFWLLVGMLLMVSSGIVMFQEIIMLMRIVMLVVMFIRQLVLINVREKLVERWNVVCLVLSQMLKFLVRILKLLFQRLNSVVIRLLLRMLQSFGVLLVVCGVWVFFLFLVLLLLIWRIFVVVIFFGYGSLFCIIIIWCSGMVQSILRMLLMEQIVVVCQNGKLFQQLIISRLGRMKMIEDRVLVVEVWVCIMLFLRMLVLEKQCRMVIEIIVVGIDEVKVRLIFRLRQMLEVVKIMVISVLRIRLCRVSFGRVSLFGMCFCMDENF